MTQHFATRSALPKCCEVCDSGGHRSYVSNIGLNEPTTAVRSCDRDQCDHMGMRCARDVLYNLAAQFPPPRHSAPTNFLVR